MTSDIRFPTYVVGLMSGTSADGVDAALLFTDGKLFAQAQESVFVPYKEELRRAILGLMQGEGDLAAVEEALTLAHIEAIEKLFAVTQVPIGRIPLIGFHGQTIRHAPAEGITQQIGNAKLLAERTGVGVVADFRSNDVREGGQGAPLVPLYHQAIAHNLPKPLMVVNIGGVANVTWLGSKGDIAAFDCGPGNALIDDWVHSRTDQRYDKNGALAVVGKVDEEAVVRFLEHPYFAKPAPKSLDRNEFKDAIPVGENFRTEDGAATLTAMTAAAIAHAAHTAPERPHEIILCGGGRHNPTLVNMIRRYLAHPPVVKKAVEEELAEDMGITKTYEGRPATAEEEIKLHPVEDYGWDGDMLEAQAFAYLAARSVQDLPLSLPSTTGVLQPATGGVFYPGEDAAGS